MFLVSRPRAPATAAKAQPNVFNQSANAYGAATRLAQMGGNLGFGFNPMQAGQIGGMNLSQYMNPYTQQVIGAAQGDLNRSRQMAMNDVGQQATAAGAFGGSRHGLVEAETNRGFADASADMSAGLRQAGYQNAQQMALADIGNRMGADQFNAATGLQAQQMRAQNMLNASGQLGNLANLGFGFGQQTNAMQAQSGAQQQALQQMLIDAAKGQYGGFTNSPYQGLAALLSGTSGTPTPSSQTTSKKNGLFDFLTAGASILAAPMTGGGSLLGTMLGR